MKTQTQLAGTFLCESEVFNGPTCQRQCARCRVGDKATKGKRRGKARKAKRERK